MSNQANRIYGYYNARCNLGPEYFIPYLKGYACRPPLEYYYKLYLDTGDPAFTSSERTSPTGAYAGITNLYSTSKDYTTFNTDNLFTFNGLRNPSGTIEQGVTIPATYQETIILQVYPYETNTIEGVVNYIDNSSGFQTSIPILNTNVVIAKGIFEGYTNMTLYLDNQDSRATRKVVIS